MRILKSSLIIVVKSHIVKLLITNQIELFIPISKYKLITSGIIGGQTIIMKDNKINPTFSPRLKRLVRVLYSFVLFCIVLGPLVFSVACIVYSSLTDNPSLLIESLYNFIVICASLAFYLLLSPLHEYGHYYTAKYLYRIKKTDENKHNKPDEYLPKNEETEITLWIGFSNTSCSCWKKAFTPSECILILISGSMTKIVYITILFAITLITKNYDMSLILGYALILEYISNCTSLTPSSDYCKIINLDKFYNEKIIIHSKIIEFLIKYIYFLILIIFSVILICFLFSNTIKIDCIVETVLKFLIKTT